jgi:hypothetical protein
MTKRDLRDLFDRWVAVLAANGPASVQGRAVVDEVIRLSARDGATPDRSERLVAILVGEALRVRETELDSLAADLALQ